MNWTTWAIPLVAVAMWILSSLVKSQQEQARRNANRPQPRRRNLDPAEEEAERRASDRANRLLEEIRRRKQRENPPPLKALPEAPKRTVTTAQRIEALDIALDARKATMSWQDPIPAKALAAEPVPVVQVLSARTNVPPTVTSRRPTKVGQNLQILLKSRQTLATALLLSEVLGPPRCKRHR